MSTSKYIPGFNTSSSGSSNQGFSLTLFINDIGHTLVIQDSKSHIYVCILDINSSCIGSADSVVYTLDIPSGSYTGFNYDNNGVIIKIISFIVSDNNYTNIDNWHL
jgi:hypothetical protein